MTESRRTKRYLALLPAVFVMGALLAPGTSANVKGNDEGWHEPIPNIPIPDPERIKAECVVNGSVDLHHTKQDKGKGTGVPLNGTAVHSFYEFDTETLLECTGLPGQQHYTGHYDVLAQGGTDGQGALLGDPKKDPGTKDDPSTPEVEGQKDVHGETLGQAWSHSANYACGSGQVDPQNVNKGDISVHKPATNQRALPCKPLFGNEPALGTSWVKFVRGWNQAPLPAPLDNEEADGERVIAWGFLNWDTPKKPGEAGDCFRAELLFEPDGNLVDNDGDGTDDSIGSALLQGTAVIYNLGAFSDAKTLTSSAGCDIQNKDTFKKAATASSDSGNGGGGGSRGPKG